MGEDNGLFELVCGKNKEFATWRTFKVYVAQNLDAKHSFETYRSEILQNKCINAHIACINGIVNRSRIEMQTDQRTSVPESTVQ